MEPAPPDGNQSTGRRRGPRRTRTRRERKRGLSSVGVALIVLAVVAVAVAVVMLSASGTQPDGTGSATTTATTSPDETPAGTQAETPVGTQPEPTTGTTVAPAPTTTAPDPNVAVRGGTLQVLLAPDPTPLTGFNPAEDTCAWACQNIMGAVVETLTVRLSDGSVAPWLAQSVTPDVSLTRWTVELRQGISFSDGTELNALAVKNVVEDHLKPGDASGSHVRDAEVVSVQAVDDYTVTFTLKSPHAGFATALAGPLGRMFSVDVAALRQLELVGTPIGTGPFVFADEWLPSQPVELLANRDYWRDGADGQPLPYVDRVVFRVEPNGARRLDAVVAPVGGAALQADIANARDADTVAAAEQLAEGEALTLVLSTDDNAGAVVFNVLNAPLDDVRVRQGLAYAIDTEALLATTGADANGGAATQWWSPTSIWHSPDVVTAWPADNNAQALDRLSAYVNDPDRSDDKAEGEPLSFTLTCTDHPALAPVTAELQSQWQATGLVEVAIEPISRTGLIQRATGTVRDSPSFRGQFDATCWRVGGERDPWVMLSEAFGVVRSSPFNVSNLSTEETDALISRMAATDEGPDRQAAVAELMAQLAELVPNVYLSYARSAVVGSARVGGLGVTSVPDALAVWGQRLGVTRYEEVWLRG